MLGSEILEVAIGLVFVFLIASLTATTIREIIESILKTRAIHLERGLRQLLDDPDGEGVTKELFDHPLLFGLFSGTYRPSQLQPMYRSSVANVLRITPSSDAAPKRMDFRTNLPNYIPS